VLDVLAARYGVSLKRSLRFSARIGTVRLGDDEISLAQPLTYMNESGRAVGAMLRYRKTSPEDLIVVLDDADLPLGRMRIRPKGGAGGHRGLASLIGDVGTQVFPRVRIGIGRGRGQGGLVDHVLGRWSSAERKVMDDAVARAADAVRMMVENGVEAAMNRFNVEQETKTETA
jgi:PTH1 family peptidyl-tRNA hydrolase